MNPVSPVQVDVNNDRSCNNWKCCFGCKKKEKEDSPVSVQIIDTVVRTYEKHRHSHNKSTPPSISRTVVVLKDTKEPE